VNGWFSGGTFGITYPALLVETYHYVSHSYALMDRSCERLGDEHATLRTYLAHHRQEEFGHEQWVLDDLVALGYVRDAVAASDALAETVSLVGSQLYVIDYLHPAGLLGYVYVMESKPPTQSWLDTLHEIAGIPREALKFLTRHGDADIVHREELREILDTCFADPSARHAARTSAMLGLAGVVHLFARLSRGDFMEPYSQLSPSLLKKELLNV
jgi:pyrroloquinoline quinone (PQQ) biosynthesis protein C